MKKIRVLLIPVGEEITPLLHGFRYVTEIDDVILIYSRETKKFAKQIEDRLLKMQLVRRVFKVECKAENLSNILKEITSKLKELYDISRIEIISNITGGTKIMALSCYMLSSIFNGSSFYIFKDGDVMKYIKVPTISSKLIEFLKESEIRIKILSYINENGIKLDDLSKLLGRSKSTIIYYLDKFTEFGLVEKLENKYKITDLGKFMKALLLE